MGAAYLMPRRSRTPAENRLGPRPTFRRTSGLLRQSERVECTWYCNCDGRKREGRGVVLWSVGAGSGGCLCGWINCRGGPDNAWQLGWRKCALRRSAPRYHSIASARRNRSGQKVGKCRRSDGAIWPATKVHSKRHKGRCCNHRAQRGKNHHGFL